MACTGFLPAQMIQKCGEDCNLLRFHKVCLTPGTTVEESFTPYAGIHCSNEKEPTKYGIINISVLAKDDPTLTNNPMAG